MLILYSHAARMTIIAISLLLVSYYGVVEGLSTDGIVLFGDSLSDNGDGFAGNARFVLRTNQAHSLLMLHEPMEAACDGVHNGQQQSKQSPKPWMSADVPSDARCMIEWSRNPKWT